MIEKKIPQLDVGSRSAYLLVNFGGPRNLQEIAAFLSELLCDRDVIRTRLPRWIHNWMFQRIARKRAVRIQADYEKIGGRSPIYFDTETLAVMLSEKLKSPVLTFHRYLSATHAEALKKIEVCEADRLIVLPLFPQFCYATTGSIARFFEARLSQQALRKLHWVKSYAAHPSFIRAYQQRIRDFLSQHRLSEKDSILFFSAHGIPLSFVKQGDPYETECQLSFQHCLKGFPEAAGRLAYQSKFGPEVWLRPYTDETCKDILNWREERKNVIFVPITFTSDHIETLYEIEELYLPLIRERQLNAYRCPALNLEPYWILALFEILQTSQLCSNHTLVRRRIPRTVRFGEFGLRQSP